MDPNQLFTAAVQFLLLLLAISVHEAAHAWTADRCGDPTARGLGRVSLNPLRHADPIGSVLFPGLLLAFGMPVFGWGRPTPVVDSNLRRPGRDDILVLASGSVANAVLAGIATVGLAIAIHQLGPEARRAGLLTLLPHFSDSSKAGALEGFPVIFTLVRMATLNAFLAVFNLIPLPPLDGGQIALQLLPPDWGAKLAEIRRYGFMIGIFLALGVVPLVLLPFYGILSLVINLF
jgi:Zn-dependent protease